MRMSLDLMWILCICMYVYIYMYIYVYTYIYIYIFLYIYIYSYSALGKYASKLLLVDDLGAQITECRKLMIRIQLGIPFLTNQE